MRRSSVFRTIEFCIRATVSSVADMNHSEVKTENAAEKAEGTANAHNAQNVYNPKRRKIKSVTLSHLKIS